MKLSKPFEHHSEGQRSADPRRKHNMVLWRGFLLRSKLSHLALNFQSNLRQMWLRVKLANFCQKVRLLVGTSHLSHRKGGCYLRRMSHPTHFRHHTLEEVTHSLEMPPFLFAACRWSLHHWLRHVNFTRLKLVKSNPCFAEEDTNITVPCSTAKFDDGHQATVVRSCKWSCRMDYWP